MNKAEKPRQRDNLILFGHCGLSDNNIKNLGGRFSINKIRKSFNGLVEFDIEYFDPTIRNISDPGVFIRSDLKKYADAYQLKADHWDTLLAVKNLIYSLRRNYKDVFWGLSNPVYQFINSEDGRNSFSGYIDFNEKSTSNSSLIISINHIKKMAAPTTKSAVDIISSITKNEL